MKEYRLKIVQSHDIVKRRNAVTLHRKMKELATVFNTIANSFILRCNVTIIVRDYKVYNRMTSYFEE